MKKLTLILLLVSLLEGDVVTKVGTTAAQFLKIGIGSRATAMGEVRKMNSFSITLTGWLI